MTTATFEAAELLPRWDLDSIFPGPESPEFRDASDRAALAIANLTALFDRHGVGARPMGAIDSDATPVFDEVVTHYDATLEAALRLDGYLGCLTAADVRNDAAQAAASEWRETLAGLARLAPRFTAWVATLDIDEIITGSHIAREHESTLRQLKHAAAHLMGSGEEDLAAALAPSGATAWMALRDELMARATARIELDGEVRELSLSEIDNLRLHPDRDVRRRAHEAETESRRALAMPLAAAINGVKGQQLTLSGRRGWVAPLDAALAANAIDKSILEAMFTALREALPTYHRYLRAKARLLGVSRLAGYDLGLPSRNPRSGSLKHRGRSSSSSSLRSAQNLGRSPSEHLRNTGSMLDLAWARTAAPSAPPSRATNPASSQTTFPCSVGPVSSPTNSGMPITTPSSSSGSAHSCKRHPISARPRFR